jgi:hypothetical protein
MGGVGEFMIFQERGMNLILKARRVMNRWLDVLFAESMLANDVGPVTISHEGLK